MRDKKLLIYSKVHLSAMGGGTIFLLEICRRLAKLGWTVLIASQEEGLRVERVSYVNDYLKKYNISYFTFSNSNSYFTHNFPKFIPLLKSLAKEVDVIYWTSPQFLDELLLNRLDDLRRPLIRCFGSPVFQRSLAKPTYLLQNVCRLAGLFYNYYTIHSFFRVENMDDYKLLNKLGFKAFYVPGGVNTSLFRPSDEKFDRFTIVCNAAPPSFIKGTDLLIKAIRAVLRHLRNLRFIILAGGNGAVAFKNDLKLLERKWSENVLCLFEWLPQEKLSKLISKSHLFVFPSRGESFGFIVLEAQSCGVPVIAFDIAGSPRDVIIHSSTGSLIPPYDVAFVAREILRYHNIWSEKPWQFAEISHKARIRALRFDWDIVAKRFDNMLNLVLRRAR